MGTSTEEELRAELARLRGRLDDAEAAHRDAPLFKALVEHASDAIFVADADGRYLYANESATALLGYERAELLRLSIRDLLAADDLQLAPLRLDELLEGSTLRSERRMRRKDGTWAFVELSARKVQEGRLVAIVRDIGDRVAAQRALRESEQLLHELGTNLPSLFWVRDRRSGALFYANPRWARLLGHAPVLGESYRQLFAAVHPADAARVSAAIARSPDETYDEVVRLVDEGAQPRWFHLRTFAIRDCEGQVYRVAGLGEDITEHTLAVEALRASEAKYRNLFENAQVGIFRSRLDGTTPLDVNARFCELVGATRAEVMSRPGTSWWADPTQRAAMVAELHKTGRLDEFEAAMVTAQGAPLHVLASATLYPEQGYFEGTIVDVTEKKRADEKMRASLREKEVLLREIHHRVKNNLQIVTSLLHLQSNRTGDERVRELLRESTNRVASIALVHQRLYESADLSRIPFATYLRDLASSLWKAYGVGEASVGLRIAAGEVVLSVDTAVPCGLLLNEILSNALKHAWPDGRKGTIEVRLEVADGRCRLGVADDGVGLPADFAQRAGASLGSKLIERLVAQLHGTLQRESAATGTSYAVTFPLGDGASTAGWPSPPSTPAAAWGKKAG